MSSLSLLPVSTKEREGEKEAIYVSGMLLAGMYSISDTRRMYTHTPRTVFTGEGGGGGGGG